MNDNMHFTEHCNPTLKAQAEKLLPTLNAFLYASVVVDAQARIVGANDHYLALIGKDFNAIADKPMREIVPGTHLPTVVRSGEPERLYPLTYDGNKHCIASSIPLRDEEESTVIGAAGIVAYEDITQLQPLLDGIEKQQKKEAAKWRATYGFKNIIGASATLKGAIDLAKNAAQADCPILLMGETGTGKELFAHAIHNDASAKRRRGPFVPLNVAGLPVERLEQELFGVAPIADTNRHGLQGKLKLAHNGTLFLDEVGDLPLPAQALLLRVLEDKKVTTIGSNLRDPVDVRIIAATSRNLRARILDGSFLAELYYRLNAVPITLPPLRERLEDIGELCAALLKDIAQYRGKRPKKIDDGFIVKLKRQPWEGNVRELRHVLERVYIVHDKLALTAKELDGLLPDGPSSEEPPVRVLSAVRREAERNEIIRALHATSGSVAKAAELLRIERRTLNNRMRTLDIANPRRMK